MESMYVDLGSSFEVTIVSNLTSFLSSVTPILQTQTIAKWSSSEKTSKSIRCYNLEDLWNKFLEWSAYGAGTLVILPSGEKIRQRFVPYLSAIQLYSNAEFALESVSASGADLSTAPTSKSNELCFEYFEVASRRERIHLANKVYELSKNLHVLKSMNSAELAPSSWMSILWYPSGHTPMNIIADPPTTCFLTYHALATSGGCFPLDSDARPRYAKLTPFGLVAHNMDQVWIRAALAMKSLPPRSFTKLKHGSRRMT